MDSARTGETPLVSLEGRFTSKDIASPQGGSGSGPEQALEAIHISHRASHESLILA
jgi:hypothetical protein